MSALDGLLGRVLTDDVEIELSEGINFKNGMVATLNPATNLTEVSFGAGVDHGDMQIADGIHGTFWKTFLNQTDRRAFPLIAAYVGRRALQLSDATVWDVLPVPGSSPQTYGWGLSCAGLEVAFTGDFWALAAAYSLNARLAVRGDLGTSGSHGTGFASWANQAGDGSAITYGTGATNGIGSAGSLNGKATVLGNGATQFGGYTFPSGALPGTTPRHIYAVQRIIANPGASQGYMHFGTGFGANQALNCFAGQTSPAADVVLSNVSPGAQTSGVVIDQWYRIAASFIGGLDTLRIGAHVATPVATGNFQIGNTWGFNHNGSGAAVIGTDSALIMHLEGTLANYNLFRADADSKLAVFWPGATAIEI